MSERDSSIPAEVRPFVDGAHVDPVTADRLPVLSAWSGQPIAEIPDCGDADVDRAVAAARKAFDSGIWSEAGLDDRAAALRRFADLIEASADRLGRLDTRQMGMPIATAIPAVGGAAGLLRNAASDLRSLTDELLVTTPNAVAASVRRPLGVIAGITAWNFPLHVAAAKIGPVLAAGNAIVLKPSELAPLACLELGRLAIEAGIAPGVVNIVPGGARAGKALALHPDVDAIGFTGSTATGQILMQYAGQSNLKRVFLECGGKSPQIVFDDCGDLDALADALVQGFTWNSGQVCTSGSRLLIADGLYDALLPMLAARVRALRTGDPLDEATALGPLASSAQRQRAASIVESASASDRLIAAGEVSGGSENEFAPMLFEASATDSPLVQREIFAPVGTLMRFSDEAEAVALANGTRYGLSATLWSRDYGQLRRIAPRLRTGFVIASTTMRPGPSGIATLPGEPAAMSGFGVEGGVEGIRTYTRLQGQLFQLG